MGITHSSSSPDGTETQEQQPFFILQDNHHPNEYDIEVNIRRVLAAMHQQNMHDKQDIGIESALVAQFPIMQLASRYDEQKLKPVIAPDIFRVTTADELYNQPLFQLKEPSEEFITNIGSGVYGSVFLLNTLDETAAANHTSPKVCYKIQKIPTYGNFLELFTNITLPDPSVIEKHFDKYRVPHTPFSKRDPRYYCRKDTEPVRAGYHAKPVMLEALMHFAAYETLKEMNEDRVDYPIINNQKWTDWMPELYGTFIVEWTDKNNEKVLHCINVLQFMEGYKPVQTFMTECDWSLERLNTDLFKPICSFLETLELHPELLLHNYDCTATNILIHPETQRLCVIDMGIVGGVIPIRRFCSFVEAPSLRNLASQICINNGIPFSIDLQQFVDNFKMMRYNSGRFLESVIYFMRETKNRWTSVSNDEYTKWMSFFTQKQYVADRLESFFSIPSLVVAERPCSMQEVQVIRQSNRNALACSYSDIRMLARSLYKCELVGEYERWFQRLAFFETINQPDQFSQLLEDYFLRNDRFFCEYSNVMMLHRHLFQFEDELMLLSNKDDSEVAEICRARLQAQKTVQNILTAYQRLVLVAFVLFSHHQQTDGIARLTQSMSASCNLVSPAAFELSHEDDLDVMLDELERRCPTDPMLHIVQQLYKDTKILNHAEGRLAMWMACKILLECTSVRSPPQTNIEPMLRQVIIENKTNLSPSLQQLQTWLQKILNNPVERRSYFQLSSLNCLHIEHYIHLTVLSLKVLIEQKYTRRL